MEEKLKKLKLLLAEIANLKAADEILGWDQLVNMPGGAAEDRGEQIATLEKIIHAKATSDEIGKLLGELTADIKQLDPDSDDACLIRVAKRDYDKQTKVPAEFVTEMARVSTVAQSVWEKAKAQSNFELFRPYLEKLVELRRQYADFFKPWDHVYDPLLDDFEPGMKTSEVQVIFNTLRSRQVELIKEISQVKQVDRSFLFLDYPESGQLAFGEKVISKFGYDWNHGRQDKSTHPFTTSFGLYDVRITTRFNTNYLPTAMFGTMHECGHALYELGIDKKFNRSPLAEGASMAVHESQSRMWENQIGRSKPFWNHFFPILQEIFPTQLGNVDVKTFYKGVNAVEPSLIRVEADEATYNLHIMLRLELEIALMDGSLLAKDAPAAWNAKFKEYLGIVPPDDAKGILQDMHWSFGGFGYFPTYALGNLVSAQLWEKLNKNIPNLEEQVEKAHFTEILGWLRKNLHVYGAKFEPQELVKKVTGSEITSEPYIRYLESKFKAIYNL
ncbi:MAG: carboxypeptidase M32 [Anaerolineaceae bacterium]|nr:carboxypeptidase M32 [Anaerolineaceae bacterium]